MRVEKRDGTRERQVLIGMIVSPVVLAKIVARCGKSLPFSSPYSNTIYTLCRRFYEKHAQAPRQHIEALFRSWAEDHPTHKSLEQVEKLLLSLSGEYEQHHQEINPAFVLDLADRHLNNVLLQRVLEDSKSDLETGNSEGAWSRIKSLTPIPLSAQSAVSLLQDKEEVLNVFAEPEEALIRYPGSLAQFFGDTLARDCFVSFVAPEKTGKTFLLIDVAYRAFCQRKRVAFFEAGDMSKRQLERRFLARIARHPFRSTTGSWPCTVLYPTHIRPPAQRDEVVELQHEKRVFAAALDGPTAWAAIQKLIAEHIKSDQDYFRIECHSNSTLNVEMIVAKLAAWDAEGWVADCVVIDYADILAAPPGKLDPREQINMTWKQLRRLSQDRHCLVVTATQTKAACYEQTYPLDRRCFSEDKRKIAHVTGMIGINVNAEEKEAGVMRLNWVVKREGEFSSRKVIYLATCLPLANPAVLSTW